MVQVADVAGEDDLPPLAALAEPDLYAGAAQQVTHVRKAHGHALGHLYHLAVGAGAQVLRQRRDVLRVVQRLDRRAARALSLAGLVLGLAHLYVRAVAEHDVRQRAGRGGGVHAAGKAVFRQQRQ